MTATVHQTQDRYHRGTGRDCPDCDPNRIPAGLKVTGWGEGLLGYPPALQLQQVAVESPDLMPNIDELGTLDIFEEFG